MRFQGNETHKKDVIFNDFSDVEQTLIFGLKVLDNVHKIKVIFLVVQSLIFLHVQRCLK